MDLNSCILHLNLTLYTDKYTTDFLYIHSLKTALYVITVWHFEIDCNSVKCMMPEYKTTLNIKTSCREFDEYFYLQKSCGLLVFFFYLSQRVLFVSTSLEIKVMKFK